jgi:5-methylcytosine-specific restriction endonuclease McrA
LASWCRLCLNESNRKWRAANREHELQRHRRRHHEFPPDREKVRQRVKAWQNDNPEKHCAHRKNTKHRRRALTVGGLSGRQLKVWLDAQPKVCHWCGDHCPNPDIDHLIPLSRGGSHDIHNLAVSCRTCNRMKGAKLPQEFIAYKEKMDAH